MGPEEMTIKVNDAKTHYWTNLGHAFEALAIALQGNSGPLGGHSERFNAKRSAARNIRVDA